MALRRQVEAPPLRKVVAREFPRDAEGLVEQLQGGDAEARRWAARDLAEHPEAAAAMGQRLLDEPDRSVCGALFTSLERIATPAAAAALLPLLRSEDAALRTGAIEVLATMPAAVAPRVEALLADADPDVRIFTVNLLGDLPHERVPHWLMQVLQRDPVVNVVAAAIEVLAEVGQPQHLPALRLAQERFPDDEFVAFAVGLATQRIESP